MIEFMIGMVVGALIGAWAPEMVKGAVSTVRGWFN